MNIVSFNQNIQQMVNGTSNEESGAQCAKEQHLLTMFNPKKQPAEKLSLMIAEIRTPAMSIFKIGRKTKHSDLKRFVCILEKIMMARPDKPIELDFDEDKALLSYEIAHDYPLPEELISSIHECRESIMKTLCDELFIKCASKFEQSVIILASTYVSMFDSPSVAAFDQKREYWMDLLKGFNSFVSDFMDAPHAGKSLPAAQPVFA